MTQTMGAELRAKVKANQVKAERSARAWRARRAQIAEDFQAVMAQGARRLAKEVLPTIEAALSERGSWVTTKDRVRFSWWELKLGYRYDDKQCPVNAVYDKVEQQLRPLVKELSPSFDVERKLVDTGYWRSKIAKLATPELAKLLRGRKYGFTQVTATVKKDSHPVYPYNDSDSLTIIL